MTYECRLCHGRSFELMVDFGNRAIAHRLLSSATEAEDSFPFAVHVCRDCGLVQVLAPIDPELLYKGFNFNFSSWKPEPHMETELDGIMARGPHRSVFEIGCNDGRFLAELRSRGVATAMGVEPNPVPAAIARERGLTVFESWLTPDICAQAIAANGGHFDLVVSRQVIEHIVDLDNYFQAINQLLADDGLVFLDMPDLEPGLRRGDCSGMWEEHVSYFTAPVLAAALKRHGLIAVQQDWYDFSGGCLSVLARRAKPGEVDTGAAGAVPVSEIISLASDYGRRLGLYQAQLEATLDSARAQGAEVVVYGVGVRGCCALNGMTLGNRIDFAVDDQKERQGKFMPGCHLEIRPSAVLADSERPLVCLLAVNNENEKKVVDGLVSRLTRPVSFLTLCSPIDIAEALASFPMPLSR